jgi:hypothetical protein
MQSECRRLQSEMLGWSKDRQPRSVSFDGTVASLIRCYQHDEDSPFHGLRFDSRANYCMHMSILERNVGRSHLSAIKGRDLKHWFEKWSVPAKEGGRRRVARAHALITMLRVLTSFGISILEDNECARLRAVLSEMRFENVPPRSEVLTAEHAIAIRAKAHEMDLPSVALAQAFMFELMLRQKDVIGDWVAMDEPGVSAVHGYGQKWLYGIDWSEVSTDLILTHRLSKSLRGKNAVAEKNTGKTKVFDLKLYPMIMEELARLPSIPASGPIIVDEKSGLPYLERNFLNRWRGVADAAEVPRSIQNRDSRAGAITEAVDATDGNIEAARHAAGHSKQSTTLRYSRMGDKQTAVVAQFRAKKRT